MIVRLSLLLIVSIEVILGDSFNSTATNCANVKNDVTSLRKRRHITFPDGSNVVLTMSLVKTFLTHAPSGWNIALEIDVMFPLPDANFTLAHSRRKLHHRQKREIWDRVKGALDFHNLNGHVCVLRSICDAKQYLLPPGVSLIHDILRAVFTAPQHEEDFMQEMKSNYGELSDPEFCNKVDDCPFSLLNFLSALNTT